MRFPSPPLQCIQHRATKSSSGQCTQLQCLYWGVFHCEGIEPRSRTTVSAVWSTISPPSPIPVSVAEWWERRVGSGRRSYPGRRWRPPPATCPRHYHRGNRHFRFEAFVKAWSFSADSQVYIILSTQGLQGSFSSTKPVLQTPVGQAPLTKVEALEISEDISSRDSLFMISATLFSGTVCRHCRCKSYLQICLKKYEYCTSVHVFYDL